MSRACAAFCALLSSACVETYDGDGVLAEELRAVSGFDRVSLRGALDVQLSRAESVGLAVRIDQNLIRRVRTSVSESTLIIEVEGGNLGDSLPGPHVVVSLPSLRHAELNGSGRLVARGFEQEEPASVELSGSGEVSWTGTADALDAVLAGSGTLELSGAASSVELHASGSGALDARALTAQSASIELEGSGSVSLTVDGRVDASVSGGGEVELYGDVVRGTWDESDGTIDAL